MSLNCFIDWLVNWLVPGLLNGSAWLYDWYLCYFMLTSLNPTTSFGCRLNRLLWMYDYEWYFCWMDHFECMTMNDIFVEWIILNVWLWMIFLLNGSFWMYDYEWYFCCYANIFEPHCQCWLQGSCLPACLPACLHAWLSPRISDK